ncbi:voltage-dependent L-type calcium channel subunit alpha-1C-like [Gadus macrocephalus]|uniref:voltage-dependent L-type calcium channel subunit alpha-1C-like n=1 Tax=Gadus macrocephalus TaxID=80720 RepID=UPI0028CB1B14|nr:voltage-dependent L-type calcium channel subunit alpha-1C-like [Gadus macrocephalus]XP_059912544.1 voltage-dependent L-type calcium channel subunit alpha-1C-like [Gadus macrocephalus]
MDAGKKDAANEGDGGKSDTLGSSGSARKRGGGAKKAIQANKSALRAPRALCCLTLSNPIRMAALALVEWKYPVGCVRSFGRCLRRQFTYAFFLLSYLLKFS